MDAHIQDAEFESVPFYVGHHDEGHEAAITEEIFHHAEDLGYDFLTAPITNGAYRKRVSEKSSKRLNDSEHSCCSYAEISPLTAEETNITPNEVSSRLLYVASDWGDLASPDSHDADIARQALVQEVTYAGFCGATNIMIQGPKPFSRDGPGASASRFADAVKRALAASPANGSLQKAQSRSLGPLSSWEVWHSIRTACNYDSRISVALTISKNIPPQLVLDRWLSEPIRIVQFPATAFTPNARNVDVLTKAHQGLLSRALRAKVTPWILLSGVGPLPGLDTLDGTDQAAGGASHVSPSSAEVSFAALTPERISPHLMYLREHLQRRQPIRTPLERCGAGYQDWPQSPLQPLSENLDSGTYEVFEKDPVKYAWYECAIGSALKDFQSRGWTQPGTRGGVLVAAVVGAGRGPLVQRVLQASATANVAVDVWALEKNPSAFVHLQKRNATEWKGRVQLVQDDMRNWKGPMSSTGEQIGINILVSELLGSLGDNELSPECLDGVQHLLHPTHGISIPSSYTAFATPVAAPELWQTIKYKATPAVNGTKVEDPLSIPYVSWLHASDFLSAESGAGDGASTSHKDQEGRRPEVQELWSFTHPTPPSRIYQSNRHNCRAAHHSFYVPHRGACHGLAGYFEAVLYDRWATVARLSPGTTDTRDAHSSGGNPSDPWPPDASKILLSTNPLTMPIESPDMISWFPLFFPFKTPFYVPDNGTVELHIWRKSDGKRVWYEWTAEVQGSDGSKVGESGWHSSESVACMM